MKRINFRVLLIASLFFISFHSVGQSGTIRGTVIEDATGEPLFGVTVQIKGTTTGAITDFDGKFEIQVDPGTYDVQASFISFQSITVSGLLVEPDKVTIIEQLRLKEDIELLEEVVITADVIKTTEAALLTVKRKSANLMDGISATSFKKMGDSDAAEAVKRVTGVSVEGGKYVYVRGLGDRYTKTILNNVDIPGLDPDRNSLQIDIFPTNLIDNMVVLKTALAEMPADFTGGVINIETKDFPEEKISEVSFGVKYNPSMHFINDFLTYEGSNSDWLGFDTDLRQLPAGARDRLPVPGSSPDGEVFNFTNSFSPVLAGENQTSFMDYSLGVSFGNQKALSNGNRLGYILSANYKSSRLYYNDAQFGEYQRPRDTDPNDELVAATTQDGVIGTTNVLIGGLAGLAYKTDNAKYRLTAMHLQNGESKAGRFRIVSDPEDGRPATGKSDFIADNSNNLEYSQRGLTNVLLNGEHHINEGSWIVDWRLSPTLSKIEDPDIRKAAFTTVSGGFPLNPPELDAGAAGFPTRIWRFLDEVNMVSRVDITKNAQLFGAPAKYKFGVNYVFKERDFEILQYNVALVGQEPDWESNDPNIILREENLFPNPGGVYYQSGNPTPNNNEYNSTVNNLAYYASAEFSPMDNLKTILGLRVEDFVQRHTGRDQTAASFIQSQTNLGVTNIDSLIRVIQADQSGNLGRVLNNDKVLDAIDLFPSVNLIYSLKENQNLRFSYSKTIARPSFKELSFAQILDPVSDRTFNGGLFPYDTNDDFWDGNLTETRIDNFDLRWELFQDRAQTYSLSAFYKRFADPIEIVRIASAQTTNEFQPRNVGDGQVFGAEFEFRKVLDFISPSLDKFVLNGNITFTESILDMTEVEFAARQNFERPGETVENTREMAGQAPYVINAGIGYEAFEIGLDAGIFYNVQGPTLSFVGGGLFPDVFSEPFHSVNFNLNKSLGPEDNIRLSFSVDNILNDKREQFYRGFGASDQVFTSWSPGTTVGFSINYKL